MKFNVILKTATSVTIELDNKEVVKSHCLFDVYLNDEVILKAVEKNVFSLYNLKPKTTYQLTLISEEGTKVTKTFETDSETVCLNVKRFNAKGDGKADDTQAIQAAIMSCPPQGRVKIPAGDYRVKTIFLKSNFTLELLKGATLRFDGHFYEGGVLPGYTPYPDGDEFYLGSWEGNPLDSHTALIQGIHVENVNIIGEGTLDGNGSSWWENPKVKQGAWRPRLFQIIHSQNVTVQGVTFQNSPAWTVHPLFSKDLVFADLKIINPKDSPNTDGLDPESCERVLIVGVYFSVGDDCIAIKSGKIYLGSRLKKPSSYITIRNCSMNFGHGAVVIGSEMAGGAKNIKVTQCLFNETDRGLRIKTRRGRGEDAIVEAIEFKNIKMNKVLSPFVINSFYFCDPDGYSEYVRTKEALPVDERTPVIRDFLFEDIECVNSEVAAGFFYGLPERPIEKITLKNCYFSFIQDAKPGYPAMMEEIPTYCKAGLIFNNVKELTLDNVRFDGVDGENLTLNQIQKVEMNHVDTEISR